MKRLKNNVCLEELEKLSSQRLNEMLDQELASSNTDKELILEILRILEQHDAVQPHEHSPEALAAWERYRASYAAPAEDIPTHPEHVHKRSRWIARFAAAAAILCLILIFTPKAEGRFDLWEVIGQWTQDLFGFFSGGQPDEDYTFTTEDPQLQQIYDAVAQQGVTDPVVPTWIPEGYELTELRVVPAPQGSKIHACLTNGDRYILLTYEFRQEEITNKYAKDEVNVEEYESGGIKHYFMSNIEMTTAAWTNGNLECSIATNLEKETLCQIIDSIYRR